MIFVVDDEPTILDLIATILRDAGFSVLTASSGIDALALARLYRGKIKLLITDIVMPRLDGRTLASRLTAEDPNLPVLFMSGTCDCSEVEQHERVRFLAKPFSPGALLAEVKALMSQRAAEMVS